MFLLKRGEMLSRGCSSEEISEISEDPPKTIIKNTPSMSSFSFYPISGEAVARPTGRQHPSVLAASSDLIRILLMDHYD